MQRAGSFCHRPRRTASFLDYGLVLVVLVVVVDVDVDVLVVGPPALPAEAASAIPIPASATADKIIGVLVSQFSASCTPAGFPGSNVDESASALVVLSANDVAKQRVLFISKSPQVCCCEASANAGFLQCSDVVTASISKSNPRAYKARCIRKELTGADMNGEGRIAKALVGQWLALT